MNQECGGPQETARIHTKLQPPANCVWNTFIFPQAKIISFWLTPASCAIVLFQCRSFLHCGAFCIMWSSQKEANAPGKNKTAFFASPIYILLMSRPPSQGSFPLSRASPSCKLTRKHITVGGEGLCLWWRVPAADEFVCFLYLFIYFGRGSEGQKNTGASRLIRRNKTRVCKIPSNKANFGLSGHINSSEI